MRTALAIAATVMLAGIIVCGVVLLESLNKSDSCTPSIKSVTNEMRDGDEVVTVELCKP